MWALCLGDFVAKKRSIALDCFLIILKSLIKDIEFFKVKFQIRRQKLWYLIRN